MNAIYLQTQPLSGDRKTSVKESEDRGKGRGGTNWKKRDRRTVSFQKVVLEHAVSEDALSAPRL